MWAAADRATARAAPSSSRSMATTSPVLRAMGPAAICVPPSVRRGAAAPQGAFEVRLGVLPPGELPEAVGERGGVDAPAARGANARGCRAGRPLREEVLVVEHLVVEEVAQGRR